MPESHPREIDGRAVIDTRETVGGTTVYVVDCGDDHYADVTADGAEVTIYPLADPDGTGVNDYVQTDPDGASYITETEASRMLDRAVEMIGILPDGTVCGALAHGTVVWPHPDRDYASYRDTPFEEAIHSFVSPTLAKPHVEANRYAIDGDLEVGHTEGVLRWVNLRRHGVDEDDAHDLSERCARHFTSGGLPVPAPILVREGELYAHEAYVDAVGDMVAAEAAL